MKSEAFSAIIMVAAFVFAETMVGITDASTIRRPVIPRSTRSGVTTRERISAHAAAAHCVIHGRAARSRIRQQRVVIAAIPAGHSFSAAIRGERVRREQPARPAQAGDRRASIFLRRKIVRLDRGRVVRVRRAGAHIAAALRPRLPDAASHAGEWLQRAGHALVVARGREDELQVRLVELRPRTQEHADMGGLKASRPRPRTSQWAISHHSREGRARSFSVTGRVTRFTTRVA